MTHMDLNTFLLARLDEDEQLARDVIKSVGPHRAGEPFTDGSGQADRDAFPSYPWGAEHAELPFMAGPGHPARVLAEVQAKRQIVERARFVDNHGPAVDHVRSMDMTTGASAALRDVLQLLALPYAEHPECHPSWLPPT